MQVVCMILFFTLNGACLIVYRFTQSFIVCVLRVYSANIYIVHVCVFLLAMQRCICVCGDFIY